MQNIHMYLDWKREIFIDKNSDPVGVCPKPLCYWWYYSEGCVL